MGSAIPVEATPIEIGKLAFTALKDVERPPDLGQHVIDVRYVLA